MIPGGLLSASPLSAGSEEQGLFLGVMNNLHFITEGHLERLAAPGTVSVDDADTIDAELDSASDLQAELETDIVAGVEP